MLSSSSFLLAAVGLWSVLSPVAVASASQVWGEKRSLWNDGGQEGICEAFVACGWVNSRCHIIIPHHKVCLLIL